MQQRRVPKGGGYRDTTIKGANAGRRTTKLRNGEDYYKNLAIKTKLWEYSPKWQKKKHP